MSIDNSTKAYFEALYTSKKSVIQAFISHHVWNKEDAEELTNDVFRIYFQKYNMLPEDEAMKVLMKIAFNVKGNYFKKIREKDLCLDDIDCIGDSLRLADEIEYTDTLDMLSSFLEKEEYDILMAKIQGLSLSEYAEQTKITYSKVWGIWNLAKKKIRYFFDHPEKF